MSKAWYQTMKSEIEIDGNMWCYGRQKIAWPNPVESQIVSLWTYNYNHNGNRGIQGLIEKFSFKFECFVDKKMTIPMQ